MRYSNISSLNKKQKIAGGLFIIFIIICAFYYFNIENNTVELKNYQDIEVYNDFGDIVWKNAKDLKVGDIICINDNELNISTTETITNIKFLASKVIFNYS